MQRDAHLAAGGEDVGGAVVVGAEERAVARRRHRELLDVFAERGDVLARLTQRGRELLVLGDGLGELALGLEQALLERADALRGVLQPATEDDDLFLEALDRLLELGDLPLVIGQPALVLRGHDWAPPRSSRTLVLCSGCRARIRYVDDFYGPRADWLDFSLNMCDKFRSGVPGAKESSAEPEPFFDLETAKVRAAR